MGVGFDISEIESFKEVEEDYVYDLSIQDNHNYFIEGEILAHNSSKTWDTFHLIYAFCDHNKNQGNDIYILRDTLTNCRDYTFKDFKKCMETIGVKLDYSAAGQKPHVDIFGNNVYFRGLDDEKNTEGYPSDIIFINEALETQKNKVDGLKMRCRKLMIMDWNPKFTDHWCFDLEGQPNVFFTRTNYKNNKHLQKSVRKEIESYEPWLPGSYYIENNCVMHEGEEVSDKNQPPPHPTNTKQNTADEFRWKVYGLGLRGAMKGLIYPNVTWIDEMPNIAHTYGMDFGFTNDPTAIVRFIKQGKNIYVEPLCYQPIDNPQDLSDYMDAINIERHIPITADSSDRYTSEAKGTVMMVIELYDMNWEISKVSKNKSLVYWIGEMKKHKIHIVKNQFYQQMKKEQENYRWKEINGIAINQPEDKYNHLMDSIRYALMAHEADNFRSTSN
jgi:PBSX family phage terminase large subunit